MVRLRYSLVLAVLLRVAYAACVLWVTRDFASFEHSDTADYLVPARYLVETGTYSNADGPEIFRTPGYPLLLAAGLLTPNVWIATILVQIGLSTLTVYVVYLLAAKFGNERAAQWGAFLFAVEPLTIAYSSMLLAEMLLTCLTALSALLLVNSLMNPSVRKLVLVAVGVASLAYVKIIAYFLPLVLGAVFIAIGLVRRQGLAFTKLAVAFVLACILLFLPWHLRNHWVADYSGFSTQIEGGIYVIAATAVRADQQGVSADASRLESNREVDAILQQHPDPDESGRSIRNRGLAILFKTPLKTLKVHVQGAVVNLLDPAAGIFFWQFRCPPTGFADAANTGGYFAIFECLQGMSPARLIFLAFLELLALTYLTLAVAGMIAVARTHPSIVIALLVLVVYFLLLAGSSGIHRFRLPVIPLFCSFAGYGIVSMRAWMARFRMSGE